MISDSGSPLLAPIEHVLLYFHDEDDDNYDDKHEMCVVFLFCFFVDIFCFCFLIINIYRDYYQSVFGYRQYHVLGIKIVLCEPLASIIHYFLFPIHDTADTQRHEGNNLFII